MSLKAQNLCFSLSGPMNEYVEGLTELGSKLSSFENIVDLDHLASKEAS